MSRTQGYALIVGVGKYLHLPDWNAGMLDTNVLQLVAHLTSSAEADYPIGQVVALTQEQATRQNILGALDSLADVIGPDECFFFYYLGAGDYDAERNYCLTTFDTQLADERIKPGTAILHGELLARLSKVKAKHVLIVLSLPFEESRSKAEWPSGREKPPFFGTHPSENELKAILGSGEGRVLIAANSQYQCHTANISTKPELNNIWFEALQDSLPANLSVQQVSRAEARSLFRQYIQSPAQANNVDYQASKTDSQNTYIATGLGAIAHNEGIVHQVFGDNVQGDKIAGDKVGGDKGKGS